MQELNDYLHAHNIKYGASFLAASSVNQTTPLRNPRTAINWLITFERTTDDHKKIAKQFHYSQNLGTIVLLDRDHNTPLLREQQKETIGLAVEYCLEAIKFSSNGLRSQRIDPPIAIDVLTSLLLDYRIRDFASYHSWADKLGYQYDKLSDRCHYYYCCMLAMDLNHIFNDQHIAAIKSLVDKYDKR